MGDWAVDKIFDRALTKLAEFILGALEQLWKLLSATVFQSPDVTKLPQVTAFASTSQSIVNACYVLAFLWVAILVMGRDTIQSRYGPGELIPRLIIGLIASNFAIPLSSTIINLANALTEALTSQSITSPGSMQYLRETIFGAIKPQADGSAGSFLLLLIGLVIAVLAVMLIVQYIIRVGVLIVAVGISPIALALHATPQTEPAAKLWWRTITGTTATVVIQAVALHTTLTVFLSPDANLVALGIPSEDRATINLLVVVCLLFGVLKVPALMRRYITKTAPSTSGQILRIVLIQQLTRAFSKGATRNGTRGARVPGQPTTNAGWPLRP